VENLHDRTTLIMVIIIKMIIVIIILMIAFSLVDIRVISSNEYAWTRRDNKTIGRDETTSRAGHCCDVTHDV